MRSVSEPALGQPRETMPTVGTFCSIVMRRNLVRRGRRAKAVFYRQKASGRRSMACFSAAKQAGSMAVPTFSAIISSVFGIGMAPRYGRSAVIRSEGIRQAVDGLLQCRETGRIDGGTDIFGHHLKRFRDRNGAAIRTLGGD